MIIIIVITIVAIVVIFVITRIIIIINIIGIIIILVIIIITDNVRYGPPPHTKSPNLQVEVAPAARVFTASMPTSRRL